MYAIKRTDQGGGYVGKNPGVTGQTYVRDLRKAKKYPTREAANADKCPGNEIVVDVMNEVR